MGIVRFALRLPHTFYVLAILILFLGVTAIRVMPTDIFPQINIPVVTVIWQYTGLSTTEMEQRVTTYSQYSISSNVNNIRNIEAQTLNGISVQKIYFQPDVNLDLAIAQIVSATNAIRSLMPAGIQPPIVVQFNASSVPVLQISLSSDSLTESQLYDYGIYNLRQRLAPIHGVTLPTPAGGKYRQIMVDIDPAKLLAKGLTPLDVVNAVNAQNLTLPSGTAKIGDTQFVVQTNAMPRTIDELNAIPVKYSYGATVFMRDIGFVRDGYAVQQNIVREAGVRSVLLSIIKNGEASTLDVVNGVKNALNVARAAAPPGLQISELFDQSIFVVSSVMGVLREGAIAAGLTALMILVFLGSWRSTLIVMISIPLAILASIVALYFLGETLNTMTLGPRRRHTGRRFNGHDREHPSSADRRTHAAVRGDTSRLRRHCGTDPGFDACHLLRLHLRGVPRGAGQVPVHAARSCRRFRHARLVRLVANSDADHHQFAAQGRTPRRA
jgi:multidrug efflux pump subunit AcrB